MAGQNKVLKPGDSIFKAGDPSEGMYLVRKGELVVYLVDQGGKEVILAAIAEGGMVGEMALFDQKPRSASVKASKDAEVTLITNDDFAKLMKQIPKWFVSLMSTLSTRLRTTNERLQKAEAGGGAVSVGKPCEDVRRCIATLDLLWNKEGSKEGQKEWTMPRKAVDDFGQSFLGKDAEKIGKIIGILVASTVITSKTDATKQNILSAPNRGVLRQINDFLALAAPHCAQPPFPRGLTAVVENASAAAQNAAYDSLTITLDDMAAGLAAMNLTINDVHPAASFLAKFGGDAFKLVKASGKSGFGVKIDKKTIANFAKNIAIFEKLAKENLLL